MSAGPTHAAFLRAINVGGRRLDMATLRGHVEAAGFTDVATVLASGNVVLGLPEDAGADVGERLAAHLGEVLGFAVPVMVRTAEEVRRVAERNPFGDALVDGATLHVGLLSQAPHDDAREAVLAMSRPDDLLAIEGRELYWCRNGPMMEATIDTAAMARALSPVELTLRTIGTIRKVAAKLGR